ncbi:MAG: TetR/AcrR family transcriptional regulator [Planctomycetes bacterium]|nr:TetR/AcrR family transcriptional regulator [Planctomycetota bacterium]
MVKRDSAPRLPAAERRLQILEAVLPVFARRGLEGAGTRDLAAAAKVSEPLLYRHFGDKLGLFCAAVAHAAERLADLPAQAVKGRRKVAGRLEALASGLHTWLGSHRAELLVLAAAASAVEDARVREAASAALEQLGEALVAALPAEGLRPGVRRSTAGYFLLQVGLGGAQLHPVPLTVADDPGYSREVVDVLLHGLVRP